MFQGGDGHAILTSPGLVPRQLLLQGGKLLLQGSNGRAVFICTSRMLQCSAVGRPVSARGGSAQLRLLLQGGDGRAVLVGMGLVLGELLLQLLQRGNVGRALLLLLHLEVGLCLRRLEASGLALSGP